jgi:putative transposase
MSSFFNISDELWNIIEPLIPTKQRVEEYDYARKVGGGRKPICYRLVFCAILYLLKTGCQWKAIPREFGASSSIHRYFTFWREADFFDKLWKLGLVTYDEMTGIAWEVQIIDSSHHKAVRTIEDSGKSPVDRGKKWKQIAFSDRCKWNPVGYNDNFRISTRLTRDRKSVKS